MRVLGAVALGGGRQGSRWRQITVNQGGFPQGYWSLSSAQSLQTGAVHTSNQRGRRWDPVRCDLAVERVASNLSDAAEHGVTTWTRFWGSV